MQITDMLVFFNIILGVYGATRNFMNFQRKPHRPWRWLQLLNAISAGAICVLYVLTFTRITGIFVIEEHLEHWLTLYVRPVFTLSLSILAANGYYRSHFPQDECLSAQDCLKLREIRELLEEKDREIIRLTKLSGALTSSSQPKGETPDESRADN